jgi:hypothetical protein
MAADKEIGTFPTLGAKTIKPFHAKPSRSHLESMGRLGTVTTMALWVAIDRLPFRA